ncbi:parasitophorous vacuole membrane protein S16 [Plasmodium brasilianum]|uniref:Sexual stage antigen s16 n=2 Tax=Plasmodium (Plasmodium) TaxID=418103 RepID=A0A1A8X929_PLAMA|nr:sexual stage antigen s16, putative [Plasmodium malariae]KAI4840647.1 parasitophorous vacuole membrane protein S16 [Plasmodium brasilianum]SBT01110.1 sexual stage antigen s16 [Plasmodium malariae]SBT70351.1 sexual stage antigen s16, putative [Plasmodium malariae]SBT86211.1 sexual stage antigen s16, putative [Plasmodium malariae]
MNFKRFISSIFIIFILYTVVDIIVEASDTTDKTKQTTGKVPITTMGSSNENNAIKKDADTTTPMDTEKALSEIKNISETLNKKTSSNTGIIISTALINMVLLVLLSAFIGYTTKKIGISEDFPSEVDDKDVGKPTKA